eukprot:TRINITY_DN4769_c0_g1_i1.p1 TRINITY_DN4769_c0_g1~~TRINITY_DN4769_c0_g1_i1.p1  ORF type:complete len:139 (-),score=19.79 TRINITY_DN4769_c0_g1_i1:174-590(-)
MRLLKYLLQILFFLDAAMFLVLRDVFPGILWTIFFFMLMGLAIAMCNTVDEPGDCQIPRLVYVGIRFIFQVLLMYIIWTQRIMDNPKNPNFDSLSIALLAIVVIGILGNLFILYFIFNPSIINERRDVPLRSEEIYSA